MPQHPLPKALKTEAQNYAKATEKAKEYSNAANRQKTALRNAVKEHWQREHLPIGSFIRVAGMELRFEATATDVIDPEKVFELYENEEITREQLLRMISVSKTDAKNILGGDQVEAFTTVKLGKTADIRVESLPVENVDDEYVMENAKVRSRVKRKVNRRVSDEDGIRVTTKSRRKIKTRVKR